MKAAEYILIQDRLSTAASFNICDAQARGFPILYASQGFVDLFGYPAAGCVGVPCGTLVAAPSILRRDPELRGLAGAVGMAPGEVGEALEILTQQARGEVDRMMEHPGEAAHFQMVNRTKTGELFVCEVIMLLFRHSALKWNCTVGLQYDITSELSIKELLTLALRGDHVALHSSREDAVRKKLAAINMKDSTVGRYLQEKVVEVWMAMLGAKRVGAPTEDTAASGVLSGCSSCESRRTPTEGTAETHWESVYEAEATAYQGEHQC